MNGTAPHEPTATSPVVSEVLAAAVVLAVDVVTVRLDETVADPRDGQPLRRGAVEVEVVEVLKGRVGASPGDRIAVPAEVRSNADLWGSALPGDRFVAFCDAQSQDPAVLLTPEHCAQLALDGRVLEDVDAVRSAQRRHLTADRLIAEAETRRGLAGATWARYVWVAAREALRTSEDRFDRLMAVAEDPATLLEAQRSYLTAAYEDVTFTGEFTDAARARLVRAMVRSALDPQLRDLRQVLLGTWVPNLVRAPLPAPLTPAEVFGGPGAPDGLGVGPAEPAPRGADLSRALAAELADPRDPATTSPALSDWLAGAGAGAAGGGGA